MPAKKLPMLLAEGWAHQGAGGEDDFADKETFQKQLKKKRKEEHKKKALKKPGDEKSKKRPEFRYGYGYNKIVQPLSSLMLISHIHTT